MKNVFLKLAILFFIATPLSAVSNFNPWVDKGTVFTDPGSGATRGPEQPSAFVTASGCIIVASPCLGMFYTTGPASSPTGMNYAEITQANFLSNPTTAWTVYGSNPVIASVWGTHVFLHSGTYYAYVTTGLSDGPIEVYTSTDRVTWTLANASAIVASGNAWDSKYVTQLNVLAIVGGTWYGYYAGANSSTVWSLGLATSSDGINWTPDAGNPKITYQGPSNFTSGEVVGSTYYAWTQIRGPGYPGSSGQLPSDIMRFSSSSPSGPWTPLGIETFYRTLTSEGVCTPTTCTANGTLFGQVADPNIISLNGNLYMFFTASLDGSNGAKYTINVAEAASTNIFQLTSSYEGVNNVPIPFSSFNLPTPASDNFNRANANPIGGNWTQLSSTGGFGAAQIVSDAVTCASAGSNCDSYYTGITWPNDQWAQITINTCLATSFVGISLRQGSTNAYRFYWSGVTGNTGTFTISRKTGGSFATLKTFAGSVTVNNGDTLMAAAIGTNLYFYWNGGLLLTATDSNFTSGSGGFMVSPTTSTSNASIGAFLGGGFQGAPALSSVGHGLIF